MVEKKGLKISKKRIVNIIISFFLSFFFIKPEGMSTISPFIFKLLWSSKYVIIVLPFLFLFLLKKRRNIFLADKVWIPVVYMLLLFLITFMKDGSIASFFENYIYPFSACIAFVCFADNLKDFMDGLELYLGLLIIINMLCMILYPSGMYTTITTKYELNWILGYKSSLQYYLYPFLTIVLLKISYRKLTLLAFVELGISIISTVLSQNMMLLAGIVCLIFLVLFGINKFKFMFNGVTCMIAAIIGNLLILFGTELLMLSSQGQQILQSMGKDFTFSGRSSIIWPAAFLNIAKSPILGYGVQDADSVRNMLKIPAAIHAHNQFLEVMLNGGFVLLAFYIFLMFSVATSLTKHSDLKSSRILNTAMLCFYLMIIFEVFTRGIGSGVWIMICCSMHPELIDKELQMLKKDRIRFAFGKKRMKNAFTK